MASNHSQEKQPTTTDGCFVLNPDATIHELADGASMRAHQIRAISALAITGNVEELRVDLQHAVILAVQWIAHDCEVMMEELQTRMAKGVARG